MTTDLGFPYGVPWYWHPKHYPNHPLNVAARERSRAYDKALKLERNKARAAITKPER